MDRSKKQIITLFALCLLLVMIWFRSGKMYAGGEEGLTFYNLTKYLTLSSYSWYELGTGFQLFTFLSKVPYYGILEFFYRNGINNIFLQASTFLILMFVGCLSVFLLIKETVGKELKGISREIVPLLSGIFYLLNPYTMTQIWGRGIYSQFFAFALIPSFLFLFVLGLHRRNLVYGVLAILVSLFLSATYTFAGNALMLWLIVFLYTVFYLFSYCNNKKDYFFTSVFFLFTLMCWIFTNLFWILPFITIANQQVSGFINTNVNILSLRGVSKFFPFPILVRLMQTTYFYYYYGTIYSSIPFQIVSFIIPAVSLFSISRFKKLRHFRYYAVMFLVGLFLTLGSNFPLGRFFEYLLKTIPYLQIFRNPFEKLGLILVLAYTPFFTIGLVEFSNKIGKRFNSIKLGYGVIILVIVLVNVIFEWPMWSGYFSGGFVANPWIEVPKYYKDADIWLRNQNTSLRLIQLPFNPGDGVRFNWEHPYSGVDPSEILFSNSSIGRNIGVNKAYYNVLGKRFGVFQPNISGPDPDLSQSEFKSNALYQELEKLGVGYIILHHDVNTSKSGMKSVEETSLYLSKEINIKKVKTFGELDIYQVGTLQDRSIVYSPNIPLTFSKINPTLYEVKVKNVQKSFDLYFLELFDNGWDAYVGGVKLDSHGMVFSYANSWRLDKKGDYSIIIKYKPQDIVKIGEKISLYSTIVLVTICGVLILFKRRIFK